VNKNNKQLKITSDKHSLDWRIKYAAVSVCKTRHKKELFNEATGLDDTGKCSTYATLRQKQNTVLR